MIVQDQSEGKMQVLRIRFSEFTKSIGNEGTRISKDLLYVANGRQERYFGGIMSILFIVSSDCFQREVSIIRVDFLKKLVQAMLLFLLRAR